MHRPVDPVRYAAAAARFRAFFDELGLAFVERDDVLRQVALALLCREHVLLMGPPGTAKSQIASAVFARIIDETTGEPSLYARQITESTIQTDLVGPLDFKTLMETGRTEHFTDEGMLGAVHAFLDEVFDGRDMLLRSALNVLHERELKQGTRVTRGRIECALMTSNRYIADILEGARETLLAFVDRIAFIGFVPRGFARRENLGLVLRRHAGGAARPGLDARLTVQDLDVLQDAVEATWLSDPACDALAGLLEALDAELHAAARADPSFIPTRYLSTRTAVRAGRVLRAACVHSRIFKDPERPLEVRRDDFPALRLHFMLAGPAPADVERLLEREVDPHERRQLSILRTEREIFDRCMSRVPSIPESPRPPAPKPRAEAPPPSRRAPPPPAPPPPPAQDPREPRLLAAVEAGDTRAVAELLRELLPVARSDQPAAARAAALVDRAVASLQGQAIEAALAQGDRERPRAGELHRVVRLAGAIEEGGGAAQGIARWLRGRALAKIDEMATFSPGASASDLEAAAGLRGLRQVDPPAGMARDRAERRLADLEELHELRRRLLAQGTDAAEREASRAAWERAVDAAEDDLSALLDAALREVVAGALGAGGGGGAGGASVKRERAALRGLLDAIRPAIEQLDAMAARLEALRKAGGEGERKDAAGRPALKARVLGPRLGSVIEAALARMEITDREALLGEIEGLLATLGGAGLGGIIAPRDWLSWSTEALLRADRAPSVGEGDPTADGRIDLDYEGYRRLRAAEQRVPNAYTLAEIALRVAPAVAAAPSPAEGERALAALAAEIPGDLRDRAVRLDLGRIERAVGFLERWWGKLTAPQDLQGERVSAEAALRSILLSKFFNILWDESALSRFAAEASLIAEVFPAYADEAARLCDRLEALDAATRRGALDLLRRRADSAWADTLQGAR